jgi:hypothetical protein
MEEKLINNLIHGFPFSFPFWRAPLDHGTTLEEAFRSGKMCSVPGCDKLTEDQMEKCIKNVKYLFAIYASGKKNHPRWTEAKHAVRAFPNSYKNIMGIPNSAKNWMPKLV